MAATTSTTCGAPPVQPTAARRLLPVTARAPPRFRRKGRTGQEETFAAPGYRRIERLEIYSARRLWWLRRSGSRTTKSNVGCGAGAA
ncbi:MAG: hypothetical protein H6R02_2846 [Burkholderiaceae bacterium]|nr:hypothetical protein [Burkholderiaceae bacterium]